MTKVEAIKKVLEDNGGIAVWGIIYNQLESYYPDIKSAKDWKAGVRGVLYRDLGKSFKMVDEGLIALLQYDEQNLILQDDILDTSKSVQAKVRIGQDRFRKNLLKYLKTCPITGIDEMRILSASHIKPWALSSNWERLDIYNGFIFSPTVDKLFDKGLITFEDNKELIVSPQLTTRNTEKVGIVAGKKYTKLPTDGRLNYLQYHRDNIFVSS